MISLNFVEIRICIFRFFVNLFMILNMDVRLKYRFVCLYAVLCKDWCGYWYKRKHSITG